MQYGVLLKDRRLVAFSSKAQTRIPKRVVDWHVWKCVGGVKNAKIEFDRNKERYAFLRWGQGAFSNFKVVPPDTGIVHQVNLEYLARVIFDRDGVAYPDTVVGTDSHTTMINGVGVLGWGVGGIEAEAAMLGQPITMLIPQVIGFKLNGKLPEGTTATDLVLTVTEMLRKKGVVGKFVEFYGDGLADLTLADRATIANMAPEYGATCGIFPVDGETIRYLELTGRDADQIARIEAYAKEQGMWRIDGQPDPAQVDPIFAPLAGDARVLSVHNKCDQSGGTPGLREDASVGVSALTGAGVVALIEQIRQRSGLQANMAGEFSARRRHLDAIDRAWAVLRRAAEQLHVHQAPELLAEDLSEANRTLGEINGPVDTETLLGEIFSSFCVGK